jgi:hypothetical protein
LGSNSTTEQRNVEHKWYSQRCQCLKYSDGNHEVSYEIYEFDRKRNFGYTETASNVSLISLKNSVELSEVSEDFSEWNASVGKSQNFELLCRVQYDEKIHASE